jgi:hypothetical protein
MEKVTTKAPVRPKRKPVGIRNRLSFINTDPTREYRIIDATPDRIAQFEEGSWRIENIRDFILGGQRTDIPTPVDNSIAVGGGKRQILVSIEKDLYKEDQAEKQAMVDAREAGIKPQKSEGQYGEVKLTSELRKS